MKYLALLAFLTVVIAPISSASEFDDLQVAAENGDPAAQYLMGLIHAQGIDVEKNRDLGIFQPSTK